MAASSKITAAFTATAQGMQKGIGKVVESLNKVTKASQKTNKQLASLNTIGKFLVFDRLASYAARATGVLVRFGKTTFDVLNRTVQVATNVAEETSKSFQVFGDSAQSIIDFAKGASSLGLAEDQALQAAAGFGSLFKVIGSSEEEAAAFSKNLTKLAADMASFNNTTVDEALIALSAGLRGESEPLKRFAVFLNDATLKQEALSAGIIKSAKGTLPPAAKALAAYNVILKQTTQQQGDFARTAGGLANLSRIVTAQATNLAGAIGKSFEPIWRGAAEAIGKVLGALEPLAVKVSAVLEKTANAVGETISSIADDYVKWIESLDAEEVGKNIEGYFRDAALWAASWYDTISDGINKVIQFFKEPPEWVSTVQSAAKGATGIAQGAASLATRLAAAGSKIGQGVTGAAANVGIPGAREAYGFYKESAKSFWEAADSMSAAADENLLGIKNENKKASKNAADVAKKQITAVERLQRLFDEKDKQRAAQQERQQDKKPEVKAIQDMVDEVSSAVKKSVSQPASLDARSQAGSDFLLQAMTGGRQTLEKQQLDVQKKIERNTQEPLRVQVQGIG
jgi:hypothetical protein